MIGDATSVEGLRWRATGRLSARLHGTAKMAAARTDKGCDILRGEATGKLYVLELNCGGNTWHFSSRQQTAERVVNGPQFERDRRLQFDAFRTAARVLAARTNAEAE